MSGTGVYTGTFDPLTFGHLDIIRRALRLCDRLVIGIATNSSKTPLFPLEERGAIVAREAAALGDAVEVRAFGGLAVDLARAVDARFVVRGLRSGADLDYEAPMAAMNGAMAGEVETVFLAAAPAYAHIASSLVKDVARAGGRVELFVPPGVAADIRARAGH